MRILFLGLNYAPEEIGTAIYSTGLCEELVARGHEVHVVAGKPYYPEWRIRDGFRGGGTRTSVENGVQIKRVPLYVPANPTGGRRILHHVSFALAALGPLIGEARRFQPDVVMTVAPSLVAAPIARSAAAVAGARSWLHIQDFEVDAAFATGLVDAGGFASGFARRLERTALGAFDQVSSISPEMCRKAEAIIGDGKVFEFRNWAKIDEIKPLDRQSVYRELWNVRTPHVALYSGNISNKQGVEILVEAANRLRHRQDLTFIICGQGPHRGSLEAMTHGLPNVQFHDLQPANRLGDLLGLATVHLLPQKGSAADLMLPSKLTNMLASGRPVVATAASGTALAREVEGCGIVTPPEDPEAFSSAIERLMNDPTLHQQTSTAARERAENDWSREAILGRLCERLEADFMRQPIVTAN